MKIVCRNLWNFYELNWYDKELFEYFCEIIGQNEGELVGTDVANALQSLGFHQHLDINAMGKLVNHTLENMNKFSYQSLSIICNSLADLGVKN